MTGIFHETLVCQTSMPNSVKVLDISSATARVASNLSKALAILSDTRRSAVDLEDVNHAGNQKNNHISLGDQQSYYLNVFQTLLTTERRLAWR